MKILIVNQPLNNRGDESAHKALIRTLNETFPNASIRVLFVRANQDSVEQFKILNNNIEYVNLKAFKGYERLLKIGLYYNLFFIWFFHPTILKVLRIIKQSDFVICAPGGICMGGFQDWLHIEYLYLAKYLKKKIVYYGRSFGPFPEKTNQNRRFKKISYELLHYFDFVSIRDSRTQLLADSIGLKYLSTVDTAFLDIQHVEIPMEVKTMIGLDEYMVYVPNILKWHYLYNNVNIDKIIYFYESLIKEILNTYPALKIIMLPQTFNSNSEFGNDYHFFCLLQKKFKESIIVIPDTYSSDIQQAIIQKSKFVIGARYHTVVFAINNNVPFIALSYEHKISGLLESLDKQNCSVDITNIFKTDFDINCAIVLVKNLLTEISTDLAIQNLAKKSATECFNELVYWINSCSNE